MSEEQTTGEAPEPYKVGPGHPPLEARFSATNQPSAKAKSLGFMKKRRGAELLRAFLAMRFHGGDNPKLKQQICAYFNCKESEITFEMAGYMRQIEKMIKTSDTRAFDSIMDRALGKVVQTHVLTGTDGGPIETKHTSVQEFDFSSLPEEVIETLLNARRVKQIDQPG